MTEKNNWHSLIWEETVKLLRSNFEEGLSQEEIKSRQKKFGKNKLPEEKSLSKLKILIDQFKNSLVYILVIAGTITLFLKEYTDAIVIFMAVIVDALVGYIQENKSSKALRELKKVLSIKTIVIRDGKEKEIFADELVPGDLILLKPGDKVPADGRLIEGHNLKINESVLTGEWLAASKTEAVLAKETSLADRDNIVYMGTIVEDGRGKAIVTETGVHTEIGQITSLVRNTREEKTPYQKKIAHFSSTIGAIVAVICFIIFVEGMLTGGKFTEMFTTAVAVAVSSIPEGLPVAMTVILVLGMQKIFKRNGLVRKLAAAETLGSTSIIATDKTGTLTQGKMTVAGIFAFSTEEEKLVLKKAILCSEAFIENPDDQPEKWQIRGMSTEKALVLAGGRYGLLKNQLEELEPKIDEIPFNSEYKYAASLRENLSKTEKIIYVKGAPEIILEKSKYVQFSDQQIKISEEKRIFLHKKYEELTSQGYRVLGIAHKIAIDFQSETDNLEESINDLVFVGFIFLEDPIRKEAKSAIQTCYQAGMKPIIVTGDHKLTAKAIANQLGFNVEDENILEGKDLEKMSDAEFDQKINRIQIFARLEPKHKLRIIKALQKRGEIVAMTGDGINDAPALKQADIGVALGSGTQVAKEVSDLVLLTDDFYIIVSAVEEGRAILDNIRKVITYLLSDSFTEVILISASMIAGLPLPVTAVQILWINLIEDGLPDIALAFEPKEKDLMQQKPQGHDVPLLTREMKIIIFIVGLLTDLLLLGLFFWLWYQNHDIVYVRTMVFACLAIDSISYVFCCKSLKKNLWHTNFFDNKLLIAAWFLGLASLLLAIYVPIFNQFLGTMPLSLSSWSTIALLAIVNVALIEAVKHYFIVRHQTEV